MKTNVHIYQEPAQKVLLIAIPFNNFEIKKAMNTRNFFMIIAATLFFLQACGPADDDRGEAEHRTEKAADDIIKQIEEEEKHSKELEKQADKLLEKGNELREKSRAFLDKLLKGEFTENRQDSITRSQELIEETKQEIDELYSSLDELGRRKHEEVRQELLELSEKLDKKLKEFKEN